MAKKLLAEAGHPNGFDAGDYYCDASYANLGEAVINNLAGRGHPRQAAAARAGRLLQGATRRRSSRTSSRGRAAPSATPPRGWRRSSVKGGAYVYGNYPDIDELFPQQATEIDRKKREAISFTRCSSSFTSEAIYAPIWQLAFINGAGPTSGRVGLRPDRRPRLLGALRGRHAEGQVGNRGGRHMQRRATSGTCDPRTAAALPAARASAGARRPAPTQRGRHDQLIVRRIGYSMLSLFLLSLTIFLFVRVTGDPTTLLVEPGASQADIDAMREQFGLDRPIWVQYWTFMASLVHGDLGQSFYYRTPVFELYLDAPAELAAAGARRDGLLAADRHPQRHHGGGARRRLLGRVRQDVHAARSVAALVLGRPGADPVVLGLSRVAAVVGIGHAAGTSSCRPSRSAGISPPRTCG